MYRAALKYRLWMILVSLFVLSGCATLPQGCLELKEMLPPDSGCQSGYRNGFTAITGHPAECLTMDELNRIKKECSNWR